MPILNQKDFENAKRDIDDIGQSANERKIVVPRYGAPYKSLPLISDQFQDAINTIVNKDGIPAAAISVYGGGNQQDTNDFVQLNIDRIDSQKADLSVVDAALQNKADLSYVDAVVSTKAEKQYIDDVVANNEQFVNEAISNLSTLATKFYPTKSEGDADIANLEVNQPVQIGEAANGGLYYKASASATSLTKSAYDPAQVAKNYTDSAALTMFDQSMLTFAGMIDDQGRFVTTTTVKCTDFIPILSNTNYSIYSQIVGTARHAWYDKDKKFIAAFGTDQSTLSLKTYTSPINAVYFRVSAATGEAWTKFYIKTTTYRINEVSKIISQHMPQVDASKINYNSSDVKETLDSVISKQNTIIANQNGLASQLDLITDKEAPYFVNTSLFTKSGITPTNFDIVDVTARVSDSVMTVSNTSAFVYSSACVVYDAVANTYTSHAVLAVSGSNVTVTPRLPSAPSKAQTMMDAANGQHLTLFGTKALADYTVSQLQKYSYKKTENLLFSFKAPNYVKQTSSNGQITTDGTNIAIPVRIIGTAKTGGVVAGTVGLQKWCDIGAYNLNIGTNPHTQYLGKAYELADAIAGNGFEISFDAQSSDGFIEIPLAVRDESYVSSSDSQTYKTSGRARLQVFNGSTSIHDAVYSAGQVHQVLVNFEAATVVSIRVTCETSSPTVVHVSGIFTYKKAKTTSVQPLFDDGDVVAFLGDSWTQYPIATAIGETGQTRPDGSISTGSQWLSRRMKEKLQTQGKNVTMLNMGFGGQTSRWGKYWVNTIIALEPKPTHCVLCFYINDRNGIETPSLTAYDFDPSNMFVNKTVASGGVDGRVRTYDEWESNLKWLCEKLSASGIKPIVIMPSHVAAVATAQGIRQNQLVRLADGF